MTDAEPFPLPNERTPTPVSDDDMFGVDHARGPAQVPAPGWIHKPDELKAAKPLDEWEAREAKRINRLERICEAHIERIVAMPKFDNLEGYAEWAEQRPKEAFVPSAWFNRDGNQLHVVLENEHNVHSTADGRKMSIGKTESGAVGEVMIYGLREICADSGFMVVPYEEWKRLKK